jgi:hypothetical protein
MEQKEVGPFVYRSLIPRLRVGFRKPRTSLDGKPVPFKSQQFNNGRLILDAENYSHWPEGDFDELVRLMDNHPRNRAKGGREFWRETQDDRDALDLAAGKVVAKPPYGGITKQTERILTNLLNSSKRFSPAEQPAIYSKLCEMMDLFSVKGLSKPDESFHPARLRARIVEFLGVLEDNNLWKPDDNTEGKADLG